VPKWIRDALRIGKPVGEYSGTTYVGSAETLAIVFHEVCVSCNRGWMCGLEQAARPVLEPLLPGAAPGYIAPAGSGTSGDRRHMGREELTAAHPQQVPWPAQRLDTGQHPGVAVPASRAFCMPPPGARVWMGGLNTSEVPASVQAARLLDASGEPIAQCGTFSVGRVLFQVFSCRQQDAVLSPDNEAWLAAKGLYVAALPQIAPPVRRFGGHRRSYSASGISKPSPDGCVRDCLFVPEARFPRVRQGVRRPGRAAGMPRSPIRGSRLFGLRDWLARPPGNSHRASGVGGGVHIRSLGGQAQHHRGEGLGVPGRAGHPDAGRPGPSPGRG
jgi:hypothetical protein